jgi:hypothetical protein
LVESRHSPSMRLRPCRVPSGKILKTGSKIEASSVFVWLMFYPLLILFESWYEEKPVISNTFVKELNNSLRGICKDNFE